MGGDPKYILHIPPEFERILKSFKKKKPDLFIRLGDSLEKILRKPKLGKPLRNVLRNYRRVHIGSYVLVYEIRDVEVRPLDFDHHDRIYKKYR